MRVELLRLVSVVPHGVGGPDAGMINLIYTFLFQSEGLTAYNYIGINQIGEELDELILKEKRNIHINIRYLSGHDFDNNDNRSKNITRLNIIHSALLRLADFENNLAKSSLERIKQTILESDFSFAFKYRVYGKRSNDNLGAQLLINPTTKCFNFFLQFIDKTGVEIISFLIYRGRPTTGYIDDFFKVGKWKSNEEFVLYGHGKEVELKVFPDKGILELNKKPLHGNALVFEMMKSDISIQGQTEAFKNWIQSLPKNISSVINASYLNFLEEN